MYLLCERSRIKRVRFFFAETSIPIFDDEEPFEHHFTHELQHSRKLSSSTTPKLTQLKTMGHQQEFIFY